MKALQFVVIFAMRQRLCGAVKIARKSMTELAATAQQSVGLSGPVARFSATFVAADSRPEPAPVTRRQRRGCLCSKIRSAENGCNSKSRGVGGLQGTRISQRARVIADG